MKILMVFHFLLNYFIKIPANVPVFEGLYFWRGNNVLCSIAFVYLFTHLRYLYGAPVPEFIVILSVSSFFLKALLSTFSMSLCMTLFLSEAGLVLPRFHPFLTPLG